MAPLLPLQPDMMDSPNIRLSQLLRSGMTLALQKLEDDRKDFHASVSQSLQSSPNRTLSPKQRAFNFDNVNYLYQKMLDGLEGVESRAQVDAWETLFKHSEDHKLKIMKQQARG